VAPVARLGRETLGFLAGLVRCPRLSNTLATMACTQCSPIIIFANKAMNRMLRVAGILSFIGVVVFALWAARSRPARRSSQESFNDAIHLAVTNPVKFAKTHFSGGVGAVLLADPATGVLLIHNVVAGSPAEMAGLREGDHIIQVDGVGTSGRTLAQNVESIRGFVGSSVTLTVQRAGSTNLQCVIHRSSWKSLGIPQ